MKVPGKPLKTVFQQKGLNPREGQPALTTEASGSGGRKANEGKRCAALILRQNTSPCCHVENALFSPSPLLNRVSCCTPCPGSEQSWFLGPCYRHCHTGVEAHLLLATLTPVKGYQVLPCYTTRPNASPTLPAVHCCFLNLSK